MVNDDRMLELYERLHSGQSEIKGEQIAQGMTLTSVVERLIKTEHAIETNTAELTRLANHVGTQNGRVGKAETMLADHESTLDALTLANTYNAGKRAGGAGTVLTRTQLRTYSVLAGIIGTTIGVITGAVEFVIRVWFS